MTDHLSDGELIRLLDGTSPGQTPENLHIASCKACRSRLEAFGRRSRRFRALLEETDPSVPLLRNPTSSRKRALAVAAALAFVLAGSLFVQPVRAWIIAQGRAVFGRSDVTSSDTGVQPASVAPGVESERASLSFVPRDTMLTIEIVSWQQGGRLIIRTGEDDAVTAASVEANTEEGFVVLPRGLRLENSEQSTTNYEIVVPSSIARIEILVSGESVLQLVSGSAFSREELDLSTRSTS